MDEVESSSDAPSTSTAHLDDLAVHPSPNHASNQRRVVNRSHLFHRDSHFRKMLPADTDEAARQQVTEPTVVSPVEYFSGYISEEIWNALTLETHTKKTYVRDRQPLSFDCGDENIYRHNICDVCS